MTEDEKKIRIELSDLSLGDLAFLEALVRLESLKQAAEELRMSKPAASRTLSRLRAALNDAVVIRSNPKQLPTTAAKRYARAAKAILIQARALEPAREFHPKDIVRTFRVGAGENAAYAFCVPVIERLFKLAPQAHIRIEPFEPASVFSLLQAGACDAAFLPVIELPPGFHGMSVATNNIVTLVRAEHPLMKLAKERPLTIEDAAGYKRVAVKAAVTNFSSAQPSPKAVEAFYRAGNDEPSVSIPYFLSALGIIERTDALLAVSKRTAERAIELSDRFAVLPIPAQLERDYPVRIIWHDRVADDPEIRWLLGLFRAVLAPFGTDDQAQ